MNRLRAAVNGSGAIGKRAADALRLLEDMHLPRVPDILAEHQPPVAAPARPPVQPGQRHEGHDDPRRIGQAAREHGAAVFGMAREAPDLEREHWEDAGHQGEEHAAGKCEQQREREPERRGGGRRPGGGRRRSEDAAAGIGAG